MSRIVKFNRRDFLRLTAATGTGLILGVHLPACGDGKGDDPGYEVMNPNVFLSIDSDGVVTVYVPRTELGQGVRTSLPMLVAEELDCSWSQVRCEEMVTDQNRASQSTSGSSSIRESWSLLREAGAAARAMLVTAAAAAWEVDESDCSTENGEVVHGDLSRRVTYGELVAAAKDLSVPTDVPLKSPDDFELIGTSAPRLDTPGKIDGSAVFGADVRVERMLFAVVARPPVIGGSVAGFDAGAAQSVPGVRQVVEVSTGVAVVAETSWAAIKGRDAMSATWDDGPNAGMNDASLQAILDAKADETPEQARLDGDPDSALAGAAQVLSEIYEVPFLAHAPMETTVCTVDAKADSCEAWVPSQKPQGARDELVTSLGLAADSVTVHTTLAGGGFGNRHRQNFVVEAAEVSRAVGAPVQVLWTREDDMRHGHFRPFSRHLLSGGLDGGNEPIALKHVLVAPSIRSQFMGVDFGLDTIAMQGLQNAPYTIPNQFVGFIKANTPVPIVWWRSIYLSQNPFAHECFLDELAVAAGRDSLEFKKALLAGEPRLQGVLDLAATQAGWGGDLPAGHGHGIACTKAYGSFIAMVAEVSVDAGNVIVHKVDCAVDCGRVINPDIVTSQMESAVVFGLSAALHGEINLAGGQVQQGNFDQYRVLRFDEMPDVAVHIVDSTETVGGIGELGIPPIAPAVANAVFAATGTRIRKLPIGQV